MTWLLHSDQWDMRWRIQSAKKFEFVLSCQSAPKGGWQKEFNFMFGRFLATSLTLVTFVVAFFFQTPFARLLLREGDKNKSRRRLSVGFCARQRLQLSGQLSSITV